MPETGDAEFTWQEFMRRNNDELVATYGNLVHRVLTFIQGKFQGKVPQPGKLDDASQELLLHVDAMVEEVGRNLGLCHFREALHAIMSLAKEANRYLDSQAPWRTIRQEPATAATSLWVTLCAIAGLKTVTFPFVPFSAQKLHQLLGFSGRLEDVGWTAQRPIPGRQLPEPHPLFRKLDDSVVEEETRRMQQATIG